jgi:hypothetical protein
MPNKTSFQMTLCDPDFQAAMAAGFPGAEPPEKTFIITGAPRTGTSLVAGLFYHAGIHMGVDLIGEVAFNEKGLFEDDLVVKFNDQILSAVGAHLLHPTDPDLLRNHDVSRMMGDIIRHNVRKWWGLKDGRFCLLTHAWDHYWANGITFGVSDDDGNDWEETWHLNPHFIICHRDPYAVAQSLRKWWRVSIESGLRLAAIYEHRMAEYLIFRSNFPRHHVSYEAMLRNPVQEIEKLSWFAGVEFPPGLATEFVDPSMKHYG